VLALRRGVVVEGAPEQALVVQVAGRPRPAIADGGLVGRVLELLLCPVRVALPRGEEVPGGHDRHPWEDIDVEPDLDGYAASGLPAATMGRSIDEDRLFFATALAAGRQLASLVGRAG